MDCGMVSPERLRRLEVDHQLELGRLLDGQVGGLGALEDLIDEGAGSVEQVTNAHSGGHEAPGPHVSPQLIHCRQPASCSELYDPAHVALVGKISGHNERAQPLPDAPVPAR